MTTIASAAAEIDRLLAAHKFSPDGSIFAPETLRDIECRLSFIEASECNCNDSPHENAIHDLAHTDVPALLLAIKQQAAENSALRDELEALQHTDVGEVAAHNQELWAENQRLKADIRRLEK